MRKNISQHEAVAAPSFRWRALRDETGSQIVEFAVVGWLLFVVMFGIFDFSRAMYVYHFTSYAAQEATRFAIVRGDSWTNSCSTSAPPSFAMTYGCKASATDVENFVKSLAPAGTSTSDITVTATWPGTTPDCTSGCTACATNNAVGCQVKVVVQYKFSFLVAAIRSTTLTLGSSSEAVILN